MKTKGMWILLTVTCLLVLASTSGADNEDRYVDQHPLAHEHARMAKALQTSDSDALASFYAQDARLSFPLRSDIVGHEEIRRNAEYIIGLGVRSFHILEEEVFEGDEFLVQSGTCIFYNQTGQEFSRSRFMTIWRNENGNWRIYRDFVV